MDSLEWQTSPGNDWLASPPLEMDDGYAVAFDAGGMAAQWVRCPPGIPGYEHLAGSKLYIESPFAAKIACPLCGDVGRKRGLTFRDVTLVAIECLNCKQFLWMEVGSEKE